MKYSYLFLFLLIGFSLVFSQQDCPEPATQKRQVPSELEAEGFELSMAKGPFLLATSGRYAYLQLNSFSSIFLPWEETLVSMMEEISGAEGLILDLRSSNGEDLELAYQLAGCFVSERQAGHHSYDFKGQQVRSHAIKPHPGLEKPFSAPVAILINRHTRNVAEIATLLLSQLEQVILVGSPSAGSITPAPNRQHEQPVNRVSYEEHGIPVDVTVCEGPALFEETMDLLRGTFRPKAVSEMRNLR